MRPAMTGDLYANAHQAELEDHPSLASEAPLSRDEVWRIGAALNLRPRSPAIHPPAI